MADQKNPKQQSSSVVLGAMVDLMIRREPNDSTFTIRVLSDIGGAGVHPGHATPEAALRHVADLIEAAHG